MTKVVSSASTSLDGFVAGPNDEVGPLFDWYDAGDVPWTSAGGDMTFHLTQRDADYWKEWVGRLGALVVGAQSPGPAGRPARPACRSRRRHGRRRAAAPGCRSRGFCPYRSWPGR